MTDTPHVIHVVISLAAGGLERLVVDWTNGRNQAHPGSTTVCCLDAEGDLAPLVDGGVVCVKADRSRQPFDFGAVRRLRRCVTARPGRVVVHSHNVAAWQYAAFALIGTRVRHVHTEHGTNVYVTGWRNRLRNRFLLARTDCLVAVSEDTAHAIAESYRIGRESLTVIPNGIGAVTLLDRREARGRLGVDDAVKVMGSVGRLAEVKGYDRLIPVFADLAEKADDRWTLVLVGDGPSRGALEALATSHGIRDRVVFAGARPDARELMRAFDLFILPSRSEGLSIALLEAMSASVPVLVTDVGENRRVLDDGRCGTLLPDDEAGWGTVLAEAMAGNGCEGKAELALERVRAQYSQAATLAAYEVTYETS